MKHNFWLINRSKIWIPMLVIDIESYQCNDIGTKHSAAVGHFKALLKWIWRHLQRKKKHDSSCEGKGAGRKLLLKLMHTFTWILFICAVTLILKDAIARVKKECVSNSKWNKNINRWDRLQHGVTWPESCLRVNILIFNYSVNFSSISKEM